jgi:hypothetical protein
MQAAFPLVLFGSIAVFVLLGVVSMFTRTNLHDQIGQGGLFTGEDPFGGVPPAAAQAPRPADERELEIRQMLGARSQRLVRQGHAPLDIDAELARLQSPDAGGSHDPGLTAEVRQLVLARNERRLRRGLDALDVEVEVRRTLAELDS